MKFEARALRWFAYFVGLGLLCTALLWFLHARRPLERPSPSSHTTDSTEYVVSDFVDLVYPVMSPARRVPFVKMHELAHLDILPILQPPPNGWGFAKSNYSTSPDANSHLFPWEYLDFYSVELNGDDNPDLVFSGQIYGEEWSTLIWIKVDSLYRFIDHLWGTPVLMYRDSAHGKCSIVTVGGYCCTGYIGEYSLFVPTVDSGLFTYRHISTFSRFLDLEIPSKRIPMNQFVVSDSTILLRESAHVDNAMDSERSRFEGKSVYGNIIATLRRHSRGVILSEKSDSLGQHWYFVAMLPGSQVSSSRFYNSHNSHMTGWIQLNGISFQD